jgi:ferritin-like metal-binding protein YciE
MDVHIYPINNNQYFKPFFIRKQTNMTNTNTPKPGQPEGTGSFGNTDLEIFFLDSIKDLYWAELHLTKALPRMHDAATTRDLQNAIEVHLVQTQEHVSRLEHVFNILGVKAETKKCDATEGLVKEGESIMEETEDGSLTRDVGIITAVQKVEHYEIASYGTLVELAMTLGQMEVADILTHTLDEEKQTDINLTNIAVVNINEAAELEGADEE